MGRSPIAPAAVPMAIPRNTPIGRKRRAAPSRNAARVTVRLRLGISIVVAHLQQTMTDIGAAHRAAMRKEPVGRHQRDARKRVDGAAGQLRRSARNNPFLSSTDLRPTSAGQSLTGASPIIGEMRQNRANDPGCVEATRPRPKSDVVKRRNPLTRAQWPPGRSS